MTTASHEQKRRTRLRAEGWKRYDVHLSPKAQRIVERKRGDRSVPEYINMVIERGEK